VTAPRTGGPEADGLVLAVDGGNSKTDCALLDSSGRLLSLVRGAGSSPHALGIDGSVGVVGDLLAGALAQAGLGPLTRPVASVATVLLSGADLPEERSMIRTKLEQLAWSHRLVVDIDMLALLRTGTERGWGIAVVCGAGINAFGLAPDGREARFLALGAISGDWGGGGDVGLAALGAAVRSADGRGPRTDLEAAVPAHFGLTDPFEVSRAIHLHEIPSGRLVELAPVVLASSDQDRVAANIIGGVANEVIAFATAALRELELTGADPDVVLGGGLLRSVSPDVMETIVRGVKEVAPGAGVLVAASDPIVGAALLALDALPAGDAAKARARTELDAAADEIAYRPMVTPARLPEQSFGSDPPVTSG
jgi:N-acetylglucosamine kinase-like BadF-type ATPase